MLDSAKNMDTKSNEIRANNRGKTVESQRKSM